MHDRSYIKETKEKKHSRYPEAYDSISVKLGNGSKPSN